MCGLGLFELFINGQKVSDRVLEPPLRSTTSVRSIRFSMLRSIYSKENEFLVVLGDGWYNGPRAIPGDFTARRGATARK
ncbi:MAG: alpha-L-rhamnosidase N-terminal domain-containing protein [Candidatus Borkfalkia sp.]